LLEVQTIDEISEKLSELYLYYLLWRESDGLLNDELKDLQTWLKHILTMERRPSQLAGGLGERQW
jgi:hypothetical protein